MEEKGEREADEEERAIRGEPNHVSSGRRTNTTLSFPLSVR
jgi:hypothetical protein